MVVEALDVAGEELTLAWVTVHEVNLGPSEAAPLISFLVPDASGVWPNSDIVRRSAESKVGISPRGNGDEGSVK